MSKSTTRTARQEVACAVWRQMLDCAMHQAKLAIPLVTELGLTPGHMKLLVCLDSIEARPMGSLANQFGCDASTMTWLVDRLEERNLVERRSLPEDRRVKAVALTPQGRSLKAKLERKMYEAPPEIAALDRATLETLHELFEKINANSAP
ncbi:MAG: MarR family winged helix-turn-helix transcriptional regulator [Actinomycetota bacterium]